MLATLDYPAIVETKTPEAGNGIESYFQSNRVGLFVIDAGARLKHINHRACEIFGYGDLEEAKGKPLSELEFFFSQPVVEHIQRLLSDDTRFKIKRFPGTNLAGHFAYYCLSCNRVTDASGQLLGAFGIIEDVSDQVKKQRELNSRIKELSILAQISQVVASAKDTEEVLKVILTGVTARQGLGFNRAFLFLLEEDARTLVGRLAIGPADAAEAGRIWGALEHDDRTLLETLSIYQEGADSPNCLSERISGIRIDITNGSLFGRAMSEKQPLVIGSGDSLDAVTGKVLARLGEQQVAMTPLLSRNRPIGLLVVDNAITHEEISEHDCQFLKLIADQTAAAVERSYLYRDLKERAMELEQMNVRLAETQNQIIEAEKMSVIGEITSAVAHELRNPLTIIGGFANLMHKNLAPDSHDAEYLNIIISETQRAEAVLTDVLDFSKASRAKDQRLDINTLIRDAVNMLGVRLGNGKCRIKLSLCDSGLPIWGNQDQMLHAIYQILWTLSQDITDDVTPRVCTYGLSDAVRIEIASARTNKNRTQVEKTLRQYFANNNTKRLSLIVAEETLKHHGGSLGVESNPEEGPVLCVQLPLYKE